MNADQSWNAEQKTDEIIKNDETTVAQSFTGFLNSSMDIALANLNEDAINFYKDNNNWKNPTDSREVTIDDVFTTKVIIQGLSTTESMGLIVNHSKSQSFDYPLGHRNYCNKQIDDLFIISHKEEDFPNFIGTTGGDSGAIILDAETNKALGFVIGGDGIHTYALKIATVFDLLGLKLITA